MTKRLYQSGAGSKVVWEAYQAFVCSHIYYAWPVICDLQVKQINKFEHFERIVLSWIRDRHHETLKNRLNHICSRLARRIAKFCDYHPLRECFQRKPPSSHSLRINRIFLPLKCKHSFASNYFTKFGMSI